MLVAIYMFAILFVQLVGKDETWVNDPDGEFSNVKSFGNIPIAMLTLWECLNDGCTPQIVRPVVMRKPYMMIFFLVFVFLMVYGFLNILVGVFVESTMASSTEQQEKIARQMELESA